MYNKDWFYGRGMSDDEARSERHELRKIIGILALVGVILGLFLGIGGCANSAAAPEAQAPNDRSLVFRAKHQDGSAVALRIFTAKPCADDRILIHLVHKFGAPQEMLRHFKAAVLTWRGKDWASCWILMQGQVVSVDEEGAPFQLVPMSKMRDEGV